MAAVVNRCVIGAGLRLLGARALLWLTGINIACGLTRANLRRADSGRRRGGSACSRRRA